MIQSILIVSKDKNQIQKFLDKIIAENKIDRFDITTLEQEEAIGINNVRTLQKTISLKPINSSKKIVLIKNSENITIEAQNALLKTLEEPPEDTIIILSASAKEALLPTILSRCKIVEFYNHTISFEDKEKALQEYKKIIKSNMGDKLVIAQELANNKQDALLWIESLIYILRNEFIKDTSNAFHHNLLKKLQKTHFVLSTTNTNLRLTLENMLLSL